jgi:hypothetical protein
MTPEEKRDLAYQAGQQLLARAMKAKGAGAIEDFMIFASKQDPGVITEILLIRAEMKGLV